MAKNKIMAFALGRSAEEEHAPGLSELSDRVNGNVGLFFTHEPKASVLQWCVPVWIALSTDRPSAYAARLGGCSWTLARGCVVGA